jgi:hypothetical protein
VVAERWGESLAQSVFRENPLAAFEGRELPYKPQLPPVADQLTSPARRRKRFIFF